MAKRKIDMALSIDPKKGIASIKKVTSEVKRMGKTTSKSADKASSSLKKTDKSLDNLTRSAKGFSSATTTSFNKMNRSLNKSISEVNRYKRNLDAARASAVRLGKTQVGARVTGGIGGRAAGAALAGAGTTAISTGAAVAAGAAVGVNKLTKAVGEWKTGMNSAGAAAVGLNKETIKVAQQQIRAANEVKKLTRATSKYSRAVYRAQRRQQKFNNILAKAKKHWVGLTIAAASIVAAIHVIKRTFEMAKMGAVLKQQEKSFDNLAKSAGAASKDIIADMKRLSNQTISNAEIINKAGTAMMLGIAPEKLADLMKIAAATAKMTGQTVSQAFSDIAMGVGRQSKMILDNLGIIVSIEKANKEYAKQLGKTSSQLTDAEKKQAFLNATIDAGEKLINRIGDEGEDAAIKYQQLSASAKDTADSFKKLLSTVIEPMIPELISLTKAVDGLLDGLTKLIEASKKLQVEIDVKDLEYYADFIEKMGRIPGPEEFYKPLPFPKMPERMDKEDDTVDTAQENADDILRIQQQLAIDLMRIKEGQRAADLLAFQFQYDAIKKHSNRLVNLEEWTTRMKGEINEKYNAEERKKAEQLRVFKENLEAQVLRMKGGHYAAELRMLELQYAQQEEQYGKSIQLYAWYEARKTELTAQYMRKRVELNENWVTQFMYGHDLAISKVESFGATMTRIGENIANVWATNLTNSIIDFAEGTKTAKEAMQDFARNTLRWLTELIIKQLLLNAISGMFGGSTGLPVPRAAGGPVAAGASYLVGEKGPELFTPSSSGRISNNRDTQAMAAPQETTIINVVDPSMMDQYLASGRGQQAVLNVMTSKAQSVRKIIR